MGAGCCISEFVDVLAGVRTVQADDGEPELTLLGVFAPMCPDPDHTPTGCISTVFKEGCYCVKADALLVWLEFFLNHSDDFMTA